MNPVLRGVLLGGLVLGQLCLVAACVVDTNRQRPGFACNPDGKCQNGLVCREGLCVIGPGDPGDAGVEPEPTGDDEADAGTFPDETALEETLFEEGAPEVDEPQLNCADQGGTACPGFSICLRAFYPATDVLECCPAGFCFDPGLRLMATATRAQQAVAIDGDLSDWVGSPRFPVEKVGFGTAPASAEDFSAEFSLQWDDQALYLMVAVLDDDLRAADSAPLYYEDDSLEVFLDFDPRDPDESYGDDEGQMFATQTGEVFERDVYVRNWDHQAAFQSNPDQDWWFEYRILWPTIAGSPVAGNVIGFDVAVDDDDGEGGDAVREVQLIWNDETGKLSIDARLFGLVRLLGVGP